LFAEADSVYRLGYFQVSDTVGTWCVRGLLAAQRGNTSEAMEIDRRLAALRTVSAQLWNASECRAEIAAVRGNREAAIRLLRQAFEEGMWFVERGPHYDPEFAKLIGYPPFDAFVRPKG